MRNIPRQNISPYIALGKTKSDSNFDSQTISQYKAVYNRAYVVKQ